MYYYILCMRISLQTYYPRTPFNTLLTTIYSQIRLVVPEINPDGLTDKCFNCNFMHRCIDNYFYVTCMDNHSRRILLSFYTVHACNTISITCGLHFMGVVYYGPLAFVNIL